jgi:phage-related protein
VTHAVSRDTKSFAATIPYLRAGTSYTIRFTFTDPDGVYNTTNGVVEVLATTMLSHTTPDVISRIRFGGFVLMDSADYTSKVGVTEHNAFGFPERRLQIEDLPREDGAIELQNLWGRRSISMQGFIEGATRVELEQNLQALKRALAPRLQRLQIDTLNDTGRYYTATCESLAIVESPENIRHLTWDADFVCADPFAYDTTVSTLPEFTAAHNSTVTINNVGDTRVPLRMNVRTTHTFPVTLSIINSTSGERISPSKTLISGDRLVIDSTRKSITKNGIELDYQGAFPHLLMGGNTFTFVLSTTSGTPTILVEMVWQSQYL